MVREDLLKGLTLERIEGSNIVIARKEIVIPDGTGFFSSAIPVWAAGQVENCTYKLRGGIL